MSSPDDPLLGRVLERRYRIDAPIARGGMSSVYVGTDLRLGRRIAVKVMDSRYIGDPQFLRRFEFEARAVAGLSHPGLVSVYDQSIDGDIAFLVMELVRGGSLRELLRERGPMPPHAVAAVGIPTLGGLGTAHRAGLVHRDVKPENVLISDAGDVKVADFGLVRAVAEAGVTSASIILGTAAYLSPEQVSSTDIDARSDVYSAGVVFFELLTGRQPFSGSTPLALAYQRLSYDVPAPSDVIAGIPPQIDEIVLRATERDPDLRFDDAFAMQHALLDAVDDLRLPPFTVPAPQNAAARVTSAIARPLAREPEPGYDNPGYDNPGYDNPGYDNPGYDNPGYDELEYDEQDYADRDYADRDYADRDYADRDYADRDYADRDYADHDYAQPDTGDNRPGADFRAGYPRIRPTVPDQLAADDDPRDGLDPYFQGTSGIATVAWITLVLLIATGLAAGGAALGSLLVQ